MPHEWRSSTPSLGRAFKRSRRSTVPAPTASQIAHRIVWVNPRKAARGYAPLVAGMSATLPFCLVFRGGHTPSALHEVLQAIGATA